MANTYLVRHGETEFNTANRLHGVTDVPLSSIGIKMATHLARKLKDEELFRIYSSPLKRAMQTAQIIAGNKQIIIDPRLRERNYGTYEGIKLTAKFKEQFKFGFGFEQIDGGESIDDVVRRIDNFISDELVPNHKEQILLVSHGFLLSCMINRLLGKQPTFENLVALDRTGFAVYDNAATKLKFIGASYG